MGAGIAQVAAQHGHRTILRELDDALCARARSAIERSLSRLIEKGKISPDARERTLDALTFTTDLGALSSCDIIVEAVVEQLEAKRALWAANALVRAAISEQDDGALGKHVGNTTGMAR